MFEQILNSAYEFTIIATIFPFILIFVFAGVCALTAFGLTFFIKGLKTKWAEVTKAGRTFKIIKIVVGALMLIAAILITAYMIMGFVMIVRNGGLFASMNNVNPGNE